MGLITKPDLITLSGLRLDAARGYFRGFCACGALCTSDQPPQPDSAVPNASPTSDSDAK